ncbi:MAG: glycosyltransferase family 2 protein [Pirellulaceae bacterium]
MSTPYLSFALLNYNEEATLERAARLASDALSACGRSYELVLVDDGSSDDSPAIIRRLTQSLPHCRAIFHGANRGIGAGIRTCYFETRGEWATWFPADLQAHPHELYRLLDCLHDCDVLATYRRVETRHEGLRRRLVSSFDRLLVRTLFGVAVRDLHWIRFFRRGLLERMQPRLTSPAIDTEMLVAAAGMQARIRQEPLDDLPRTAGVARGASLKNLLAAGTETLRLRWHGPGLREPLAATIPLSAGAPASHKSASRESAAHESAAPPSQQSRAA